MIERTASIPLLVVIYPYNFDEFRYELYELDYFSVYCSVVVWDISLLVNRKFANLIVSKRSQRNNVFVVSKWLDLFRHIFELRRQCITTALYINNVSWHSNASEFLTSLVLKLLMRKTNVTFIERVNGGIPLHYPVASTHGIPTKQPSAWLNKLPTFFTTLTSFTELKVRINYYLFRALTRWLPPATTCRLVAGEHYMHQALRQHPRTAKLVPGHSDDYSRFLINSLTPYAKPHTRNHAVYLDGGGPLFPGDGIQFGKKPSETCERWYPSLTNFFQHLESERILDVHIAGHYKSAHPPAPDYYGKRAVRYGMTVDLVRSSVLVIAGASTAISYAVLFRKPLIFIFSNQSKFDTETMDCIRLMAALLACTPVNIDEPPWDFDSLLHVSEPHYRAYELACLTSAGPTRPNHQIILEDIMKLTVSPTHSAPK